MTGLIRKYLVGRQIVQNDMSIESDAQVNPISISTQRLPPVKHPIQSTGQPNVVEPYQRHVFNPRVDIAESPSVVGVGADATAGTRHMLPQEVRTQKRTRKQSHIPGTRSSNLPAVLPVYWQKKIERFYLQRPAASVIQNIRRAFPVLRRI